MASLARSIVEMNQVTEILELAHMILRRHRDHDLAQKIMTLQGYLELTRLYPDRSYDDVIPKAFDELLTALVDFHLNGEDNRRSKKNLRGMVSRQARWRGI